jgi:hypothetical protein
VTIPVHKLHENHPKIRAADWRSPLVARLTGEATYADGNAVLTDSFRGKNQVLAEGTVPLEWSGLQTDYERCLKTYQANVLTEFAALAIACILLKQRAGLEITEVTRRGSKIDYWIGQRELVLEVSGTQKGDLAALCDKKAGEQLLKNPHKKDGFVCVSRFSTPIARLWFYKCPSSP